VGEIHRLALGNGVAHVAEQQFVGDAGVQR
jgi:hypothetical protein